MTDTACLSQDKTHRLSTHRGGNMRPTRSALLPLMSFERTKDQRESSLCLLPPSIFLQTLPVAPFPGFVGHPFLSTNNLGKTQFSWCQPHGTSPPLLQGSVLYQRVAWKTIQPFACQCALSTTGFCRLHQSLPLFPSFSSDRDRR